MKIHIVVISLLVAGCTWQTDAGSAATKQSTDREHGQFYFHNTQRVDNKKEGPQLYRSENDEVICYSDYNHGALQCKWKALVN